MKTAKLFVAAMLMVGASSAFASLGCNAKEVKGGLFGNTAAKIDVAKSSAAKSKNSTAAISSSSSGTIK